MIDEPFSAVYYLGPERVSDRYELREPASTAAQVLDAVTDAPQPTFVKDMVHHVPRGLRAEVAHLGRHTLLTRDPARAIPSFANVWPDVTWEECGYQALAGFADHLDAAGTPYDVLDAADLMAEPGPTLEAWCDRHGLPFDAGTLRWEARPVPQWTRWLEFHETAMRSTGLVARGPGPARAIEDERIAGLVARARPLHDALVERAATS